MGLSYKGFQERTAQAKEEDRRNGKIIDEDDDGKKTGKKKDKKSKEIVHEAWKAKPKTPKKTKVVHRTYEQIISELDPDQTSIDPGVGEIIDLTGRKLPSLNTTLTHHSKGPTEEEQEHRLPELMHNLTLICDISKGSLIHLAKEGQAIKQKSQQLTKDQARSEQILKLQQQKLSKIKRIVELTRLTKGTYTNIISQITENSSAIEICQMIDQFDGLFFELLEFLSDTPRSDQESLRLDEIVVSALAPIVSIDFFFSLARASMRIVCLTEYYVLYLLLTVTAGVESLGCTATAWSLRQGIEAV
jgi:tuftelin-interacting protein 11